MQQARKQTQHGEMCLVRIVTKDCHGRRFPIEPLNIFTWWRFP